MILCMKEYGHEFAEHWFYTPTLIENAGGLNIIRAGQNLAKQNYHIGPRFIPYYSMHCILNGSGTYIDEGKHYSIQAGDLFCLYANHTHSYYTDLENPLEMVWIAFDGRQALSMLDMLGIKEDNTYIHNILTDKSRHTLAHLIKLFQHYDENQQFKKISLIYELFDNLFEEIRKKNTTKPVIEKDWIKNGKDFIDMYYCEGISVNDVANYVGINRTHFSNVFTKRLGINPNTYIQRKVMERASQLLADHTNSITEIALSLYYSDVYSFSRAFKNYYGVSPSAYREEKMMNR